ncbi:MAG TPA: porin family protein [Beijerinckiaceae bacterium]|jgi:outer membrane immunogenic protein|nr:porin family protein [Beijerinckiaceae bacterium]
MKKILLSSVALLGMAVAAQAADLPRRTMAPAPYVAAVPVFTWTGFYVGVNAGYGWSDNGQDDRFRLGSGDVFTGSAPGTVSFRTNNDESEGFLGGAQIGYNWQFTPGNGFVVGVETDIQGIDLDRDNGTTAFTFDPSGVGTGLTGANFVPVRNSASSLDYFGTIRGRLGYAFDRFMIYGTGGFAYGGGDRNNGCPTFVNGNNVSRFCDNGGDDTRWGYTFGGGFEWALPVSTVSFFGSTAVTFGVEGLYVNLDDDKGNDRLAGFNAVTGNPVFVSSRGGDNETDFGLVRAKLNFKF